MTGAVSTLEPIFAGGGVSQTTEPILAYHSGAFDGSIA